MATSNPRNSMATAVYSAPNSPHYPISLNGHTPTTTFTINPVERRQGLEWHDLIYKVATEHKGVRRRATKFKTILHGVSGQVMPGEMVAIMGSSGAGKSTLLNALSGRLTVGKLGGQILFNGEKRIPSQFKKQAAYVEQDDLMYAQLSVRESIQYAAALRLSSREYSAADKAAKVQSVLDSLRLTGVADTYIGDAMVRGVSGGERKRAAIGVELVTDPEFMFLDEATSGLDSNSAYHVCEVVKEVTRQRNMGVLMTIHQPNAKTFNLFDKVILLSKGKLVYCGPVSMAIDYFAALGYHCGQYENPADFYLDLMTIDTATEATSRESNARVDRLVTSFQQYSSLHPELYSVSTPDKGLPINASRGKEVLMDTVSNAPTDSETVAPSRPSSIVMADRFTTAWALPWIYELYILLGRSWKAQLRNKFFIIANVGQYVILLLLLGFTFFQMGLDQSSIQNRIGLLFFLPTGLSFGLITPLLGIFNKERGIMLRERNAGAYRVTSFYLAKFLTELPLTLAITGVYVTGIYFLANLQYDAGKFFIFFGMSMLNIVVVISLGLLIGATFETLQVAQVIAPLVLVVLMIYAGNFVNTDDVTPILSWIRYVSNIKYTYQALAINEFSGLVFDCSTAVGAACFETGEAVLAHYSLDSLAISTSVGLLLALGALFHALAYISLRWKSKPHYIWL
ncbi:hypothetical protein H4R35_002841 [Dimargaris xerosporica]|nr:hypothetical protein H4R35_002841 [Dimargaris xerosporica]